MRFVGGRIACERSLFDAITLEIMLGMRCPKCGARLVNGKCPKCGELEVVVPEGWAERVLRDLGVDPGMVKAFAVYWEPVGDEFVCCAVLRNGITISGDVNPDLMLELEQRNPWLRQLPLGSSDAAPEAVLAFIDGRPRVMPLSEWRMLAAKLALGRR